MGRFRSGQNAHVDTVVYSGCNHLVRPNSAGVGLGALGKRREPSIALLDFLFCGVFAGYRIRGLGDRDAFVCAVRAQLSVLRSDPFENLCVRVCVVYRGDRVRGCGQRPAESSALAGAGLLVWDAGVLVDGHEHAIVVGDGSSFCGAN